jgi:hypothetical protein
MTFHVWITSLAALALTACVNGEVRRACDLYKEFSGDSKPSLAAWVAFYSTPEKRAEVDKANAEARKRREEWNATQRRLAALTNTKPLIGGVDAAYPIYTVEDKAKVMVAHVTEGNGKAVNLTAARMQRSSREVIDYLSSCDKNPLKETGL